MGWKEEGTGAAPSSVSLLPSREWGKLQSMGWKYNRESKTSQTARAMYRATELTAAQGVVSQGFPFPRSKEIPTKIDKDTE